MPAQPAWATPRNVALLIAGYLLLHLGVRLWIGPTLGLDDAEQALFAQQWLPSYRLRAPPLFTWALAAVSDVTGVNMVVLSLLRYLLLGMVAAFVYLTARRLIRDPRLAALATFSFAAIYVFGYYSHHDLTHTTALAAFLAASWYVFVRLCETPTLPWYLALGLCFGLGILGKWNFAMFAVALPLACLLHPAYRRLVLSWKIIPAGLIAAAIALPPALWALLVLRPAGIDDASDALGDGRGSLLYVLAKGTGSLAVALVTYPQPFLVVFLLAFGALAWRGFRTPAPAVPGARPLPDAALIGLVIATAIALHWLLVPLARATQFQERLLQPVLMILPVYLFMLVERGLGAEAAPARAVRIFALGVAAVAGVAVLARIGINFAGADLCRGACRELVPVAGIAAELRKAGFDGSGTIVLRDVHLAGNLRVQFPQARVMATDYRPIVWPKAAGAGQCLVIWRDGPAADGNRASAFAYLARELGVPAGAKAREAAISAPYAGSKRVYRISYALFEAPQGDCR